MATNTKHEVGARVLVQMDDGAPTPGIVVERPAEIGYSDPDYDVCVEAAGSVWLIHEDRVFTPDEHVAQATAAFEAAQDPGFGPVLLAAKTALTDALDLAMPSPRHAADDTDFGPSSSDPLYER